MFLLKNQHGQLLTYHTTNKFSTTRHGEERFVGGRYKLDTLLPTQWMERVSFKCNSARAMRCSGLLYALRAGAPGHSRLWSASSA